MISSFGRGFDSLQVHFILTLVSIKRTLNVAIVTLSVLFYGAINEFIPPREPFIFISVSGNSFLMRSIPSLVIFPYRVNDSIFIFDISSGISILSINWISNLFISFSSNKTVGNSFTLMLIPLPQPLFWASALNLFLIRHC